jgi:tetratricopeptide (TPR) repeat protein
VRGASVSKGKRSVTRRAKCGIAVTLTCAALSLLGAASAKAQSSLVRNLEACNGTVSLDAQINGCTVLIESGALSSKGAAIAHNLRGNGYARKRQYDRAIREYDDSLQSDPSYGKAFNDRGVAYQKKAELDQAIVDFDEAIKLDPNYAVAFANRAQTYQAKGELDRAIRDYDEALRLQPQYQEAIRRQPRLQADWQRALEIVRNERCWLRAVRGDLQAALATCEEALRSHPNSATILDSRGFTLLKMGRWDAAIADYNSALRLQPKLATALYGRGFARLKKGDSRSGNGDIRAATAIDRRIAANFKAYGLQ